MSKKVVGIVGIFLLLSLLVLAACKTNAVTGNAFHDQTDKEYNYCLFKCETEPDSDAKLCKQVCLDQLAEQMKEKMNKKA